MPATMCQTSSQPYARVIVANVHAPGTARMFARARFGDDTENLQLVLSELVTNAVRAARGEIIGVSLQPVSGAVLCEVWDDNPEPPAPRNPTPDDLSGRGLMIVDAVALKWGWHRVTGGKVVSALVRRLETCATFRITWKSIDERTSVNTDMADVSGEEWAQQVQKLSTQKKHLLMAAADMLLADPGNLSDPLESELHVFREQVAEPPRR